MSSPGPCPSSPEDMPTLPTSPHHPPIPNRDARGSATVLMTEREMRQVASAFQHAVLSSHTNPPIPPLSASLSRDHAIAPESRLYVAQQRSTEAGEKPTSRGWSRDYFGNILIALLGTLFLAITVLFAILAATHATSTTPSYDLQNDSLVIVMEILPFIAAGVLISLIAVVWRRDMRKRMREARIRQWRYNVIQSNAPWNQPNAATRCDHFGGRGQNRRSGRFSRRVQDEETLVGGEYRPWSSEPRVPIILPVVPSPPPSIRPASVSSSASSPHTEKRSHLDRAMHLLNDDIFQEDPLSQNPLPPPPAYDASVGSWMEKSWLPSIKNSSTPDLASSSPSSPKVSDDSDSLVYHNVDLKDTEKAKHTKHANKTPIGMDRQRRGGIIVL